MATVQLTYINYNAPFGPLTIVTGPSSLKYLAFNTKEKDMFPCIKSYINYPHKTNGYSKEVLTQLEEYFAGHRRQFNLYLDYHGTPFQMAVWSALQEIPYGTTCSYTHIAKAVGKPAACRAVGQAISRNPAGIIIPCHRVIGKRGKLVGFSGGLDVKKWLLNFESQAISKQTTAGK